MDKSAINKGSLTFIFVIGIIVLVSCSIITYMNSRDRSEDNDFIIQSYARIALIEDIYSSVTDAEASRKGYFITNDRDLLKPYYAAAGSIDSLLNTLKNLSYDNPAQLANTDTLKILIAERFRILKEGIDLQNSAGNSQNTQKNIFDKGRIVQKNIKSLKEKMQQEEKETLSQKKDLSEQGY